MKSLKKLFQLIALILMFSIIAPTSDLYVNIVQATDDANNYTINYEKAVIQFNEKLKLKITGTNEKVKWKSSNKKVASVSKNGTVTGNQMGKTKIEASTGNKTFTCQMTVDAMLPDKPYKHYQHFDSHYQSNFKLTQLDMQSAYDDYKISGYKCNGVYAIVHSSETIYIEGTGSKGNSLGTVKIKGMSYIEFKKAVKLKIMNPDQIEYTIDFYPVKPTIINKTGTYNYNDLKWSKLKDGNMQAWVVFAMPNSYYEFLDQEEYDATGAFGWTPHWTSGADSEITDGWKNGYFISKSASKVNDLLRLKFFIGQYKIYYDNKDLFVYGKEGLSFPEQYEKTVISYRDLVKKIASEKYLPNQTGWDKILRFRYSYNFRSLTNKDYIEFYDKLTIDESSDIYLHEMTHYYHLESMDYGCQINAWAEGIAQVLSEDALNELKMNTDPVTIAVKYLKHISEDNLTDFENYFLNVGYQNDECYAVGYNFIRFIQKNYGSSVVYNINQKIIDSISYKQSMANRSKEYDKLFIKAIKDETSEDVFNRFVSEFVKYNMSIY